MGLAPTATEGSNNFARKKFRVVILWTTYVPDQPYTSFNAAGALSSGDHLRFSFWNCYLTDATLDFTDDILKASCTFKCPPYDRAAYPLICAEEKDSGTLSAMPAYSGSAPPTGEPPW